MNCNTSSFIRLAQNDMKKRNATFVILYCSDFENNLANKKVLMSFRWNNQFGFVGGIMEANESFHETIQREVLEETGFLMTEAHLNKTEFLCSHFYKEKEMGIHVYTCEISITEMKHILSTWFLASDAAYEVSGMCAANTLLHERLLENRFAASGKEELSLFLNKFCH